MPLTTALNYWLTRSAGNNAKDLLRREARIAEIAQRTINDISHADKLLSTVWLVYNADPTVTDEKRSLLHYLTQFAADQGKTGELFLKNYRRQIDIDRELLWHELEGLAESEAAKLLKAATLTAAVDGNISKQELLILDGLAHHLNTYFDQKEAEKLAKSWK